ncbi:GAF domain-containing protein [Pseudokineococcus marinus]|uniref:GAF domain-containing protein n=1 Tax=Pseudokineococcus marinus TaxID=351215 RepID=A0A849BMJ6_9ACTN|nr:GAF domain-containing protein [Pseudokineococcus marinus]
MAGGTRGLIATLASGRGGVPPSCWCGDKRGPWGGVGTVSRSGEPAADPDVGASFTGQEPGRAGALPVLSPVPEGLEVAFDRYLRLARAALGAEQARLSLRPGVLAELTAAGLTPAATSVPAPVAPGVCRLVAGSAQAVATQDLHLLGGVGRDATATAAGVRAYAGHPVLAPDGRVLGVLSVADTTARAWSTTALQALADLAGACPAGPGRRADRRGRGRFRPRAQRAAGRRDLPVPGRGGQRTRPRRPGRRRDLRAGRAGPAGPAPHRRPRPARGDADPPPAARPRPPARPLPARRCRRAGRRGLVRRRRDR